VGKPIKPTGEVVNSYMGVDSQRHGGISMPGQCLNGLDAHPGLNQHRHVGMPQAMEVIIARLCDPSGFQVFP
jgi:hypothetical protein